MLHHVLAQSAGETLNPKLFFDDSGWGGAIRGVDQQFSSVVPMGHANHANCNVRGEMERPCGPRNTTNNAVLSHQWPIPITYGNRLARYGDRANFARPDPLWLGATMHRGQYNQIPTFSPSKSDVGPLPPFECGSFSSNYFAGAAVYISCYLMQLDRRKSVEFHLSSFRFPRLQDGFRKQYEGMTS